MSEPSRAPIAEALPLSRTEELANAVSHGVGALLLVLATPLLVLRALEVGDAAYVVGVSVFCASAVFLYGASTLFHALPEGRLREICWTVDHAGIFLLIAGSYTPFTLGVLAGPTGWTLFGLVWGLALAGMVMKLSPFSPPSWLSTGLYLALGWLVLLAIGPVIERMPPAGIAWLVAGGLAYTFGVVFFVLDRRMRFAHLVWHLFVVAGTSCHVVALWGWGA